MPYELRPHDEDLATALRRVAGEQAHDAIAALRAALAHPVGDVDLDGEDVWDEGVHEARKSCKKIRAVARLCRDALGDAYRDVNAEFRDAAATLSDVRDGWTLVETTDRLTGLDDDAGSHDLLDAGPLRRLRERLCDRYLTLRQQADEEGRLQVALEALEAAASRIEAWPLDDDLAPAALQPSIERVYGRGRRWWEALADTVGEDPHATTHEWHQWRKRAKYLWYHVRLLTPVWPAVMEGVADDLDGLCDDLGEDHDLGVLVGLLRTGELVDPGATEQIVGAAAVQRHALRRDAADVAPRVYAEEPVAYAARVVAYLESPVVGGDGTDAG
ncbi:CHAD domain-containing protein [Euzebya sp.]|uniref:CHAD domain-containing protein n=1 Tax=Euzebya sp. TaxID=1971409 RepID=UPI00351308E3